MRGILPILVVIALLMTVFTRTAGAAVITASSDITEKAMPTLLANNRTGILDQRGRSFVEQISEPHVMDLNAEKTLSERSGSTTCWSNVMLEPSPADFDGLRSHAGNGDIISSDWKVSSSNDRENPQVRPGWETRVVPDTATLLLLAMGSLLFLLDRRWRWNCSQ